MSLEAETIATLKKVRMSAPAMALASTERKNAVLKTLAASIRSSAAKIVEINQRDLKRANDDGRGGAFVERLTLTPARIEAMANSVEEVAALPDPVGEAIESWRRPTVSRLPRFACRSV